MTNADKIRAMNDEELAAWLKKALSGGREWFSAWMCDRCLAAHGGRCPLPDDDACDKVGDEVLLWLHEPAEE